MEFIGTISGAEFKFFGYYHSDKYGSTQYLTYTGASVANQYKESIDELLNGFSIR